MKKKSKPVMKSHCATCPFREGARPDEVELSQRVISRVGLGASQQCHHPRLSGKKESHLCRGARDWQLQVLHRLGLIDQPTDEAYSKACVRLGIEPPPSKA